MTNDGQRGDLLTSAEFAARARVSQSTIERWRFEGRGPAPIKLSPRTVRYARSDVDRFLSADVPAGR
jgi:predicted DNA-binding transcriptional regulator AlpA